jgi:deazaflavin-dependent oxidoreductase (nitroreductase family)
MAGMSEEVRGAIESDRLIDITTTGRNSGSARRTEIWFHNLDGHVYITGRPGRRSWFANLLANPDFTFHLKESVRAELQARARPIVEDSERRTVLGAIVGRMDDDQDLDQWLRGSPLIEVVFSG